MRDSSFSGRYASPAVLVVDDDADIGSLLEAVLTSEGKPFSLNELLRVVAVAVSQSPFRSDA